MRKSCRRINDEKRISAAISEIRNGSVFFSGHDKQKYTVRSNRSGCRSRELWLQTFYNSQLFPYRLDAFYNLGGSFKIPELTELSVP